MSHDFLTHSEIGEENVRQRLRREVEHVLHVGQKGCGKSSKHPDLSNTFAEIVSKAEMTDIKMFDTVTPWVERVKRETRLMHLELNAPSGDAPVTTIWRGREVERGIAPMPEKFREVRVSVREEK